MVTEAKTPTVAELLGLGVLVTLAAITVPDWLYLLLFHHGPIAWREPLFAEDRYRYTFDCLALIFGLAVALWAPLRSGLRLGKFRRYWPYVLAMIPIPPLIAWVVYRFTSKPFAGESSSMWTISPLAQDLVFIGFLYGQFEKRLGKRFWPAIPINPALLLTGLFFAFWHLPNLESFSVSYVVFQLGYVFVGTLWSGMTRILTGSILWAVIIHMAVNGVAWWMG